MTLPNRVTRIGNYAFAFNKIPGLIIPSSVTSIEEHAFLDNRLTSVVVPSSVMSLGYGVFRLNSLTSATIEGYATTFESDPDPIQDLDPFDGNPSTLKIIGYDNARQVAEAYGYGFEKLLSISVGFDPGGGPAWAYSHAAEVTVALSSSYGVTATPSYRWTATPAQPDAGGWTAFASGATIAAPPSSGGWYLHVRIADSIGNHIFFKSSLFQIDRTPPSIQLNASSTAPTNRNVTVTAAVADAHSGAAATKWAQGDRDVAYFATGGTALNGGSFEVAANGNYSVYARDAAGNENVATIAVSNIYTEGPAIQLTPTPPGPTNGNVTVTAAVYAPSGIYEAKFGPGRQGSGYFANGGTPLAIVDGTAEITVSDNGWISVYARDLAGNETVAQWEATNIDREKPVMELIGDAVVEIRRGTSFADPGVTASDAYDGDLTSKVAKSGDTVDTSTVGEYAIHYDVADEAGNAADRVSRTVKVTASPASSGGGGGGPSLSGNAELKKLELLANGNPIPLVKAGEAAYTAETEAGEIELKPEPEHEGAKIRVMLNGEASDINGKASLREGDNVVELTVKAEDGTKKTYTVTVRRKTAKPESATFGDIGGHWAERHIRQAIASNLVSGYPDGTFRPNAPVTRAEFVVMLMKALGKSGDQAAAPSFADASDIGAWARSAIGQAAKEKVVGGYPDGTLRPDGRITRAELAAMAARAFGLKAASGASGFADDASLPAWARGEAEALRQAGALQGRGGGNFAPDAEASRAEALTILLRLLPGE